MSGTASWADAEVDEHAGLAGVSAEDRAFAIRLQVEADRRREEQEFATYTRKPNKSKAAARAETHGPKGDPGGGAETHGDPRETHREARRPTERRGAPLIVLRKSLILDLWSSSA